MSRHNLYKWVSFQSAPTPWALAELPTGGTVRSGGVSINPLTDTQLVINQSTPKAIIDWEAFSISSGKSVQFIHANSSDITLNRVTGAGVSAIDGALLANGQVWLINPNGVLIGAGGQINSTGFLATTRNLADADFLAGRYQFTDSGQAGSAIVNQGRITAVNGGYVVLAGEKVSNEGLVQADLGSVVLGGAQTFVLDVAGDKLLSFAITTPVTQLPADGSAIVNNSGTLQAEGGRVLMTASAVAGVIGSVVNTSGLIQANSVNLVNGEVVLEVGGVGSLTNSGTITANGLEGVNGGVVRLVAGGRIQNFGVISANADTNGTGNGGHITLIADTNNPESSITLSGSLTAQAGNGGGNGGFVETSGSRVNLDPATRVNTSAPNGVMGTWLIGAPDLSVLGGYSESSNSSISADTLAIALESNNVTLAARTGNYDIPPDSAGTQVGSINVNAPLSWTSVSKLTLSAYTDIYINADISAAAGRLALHYGQGRVAAGNTSAYNISQSVTVALPAGQRFSTKLGSDGVETSSRTDNGTGSSDDTRTYVQISAQQQAVITSTTTQIANPILSTLTTANAAMAASALAAADAAALAAQPRIPASVAATTDAEATATITAVPDGALFNDSTNTAAVLARPVAPNSSAVVAALPSPVGAVKPPTPKDAADKDDKTLAAASALTPTPAPYAKRMQTGPASVSLGFVSIQPSAPATLPAAALTAQQFSLTGNRSAW